MSLREVIRQVRHGLPLAALVTLALSVHGKAEAALPVVTGLDLSADKLWFVGDFNPGGRIQLWSLVTAKVSKPTSLPPKTVARATYWWCTAKSAAACTRIGDSHSPIKFGESVETATHYRTLPLTLGTGKRYLRVQYTLARAHFGGEYVDVQNHNLGNNEAYLEVKTGSPGTYKEFPGKEIDGNNRKKLKNVSLVQCQVACSQETGFVCRSVDYAKSTKECMLQEIVRLETMPVGMHGSTLEQPPPQLPLTKSPKGKWSHYARPCQYGWHPTECRT